MTTTTSRNKPAPLVGAFYSLAPAHPFLPRPLQLVQQGGEGVAGGGVATRSRWCCCRGI